MSETPPQVGWVSIRPSIERVLFVHPYLLHLHVRKHADAHDVPEHRGAIARQILLWLNRRCDPCNGDAIAAAPTPRGCRAAAPARRPPRSALPPHAISLHGRDSAC